VTLTLVSVESRSRVVAVSRDYEWVCRQEVLGPGYEDMDRAVQSESAVSECISQATRALLEDCNQATTSGGYSKLRRISACSGDFIKCVNQR
jgi:hypothetical protein